MYYESAVLRRFVGVEINFKIKMEIIK